MLGPWRSLNIQIHSVTFKTEKLKKQNSNKSTLRLAMSVKFLVLIQETVNVKLV